LTIDQIIEHEVVLANGSIIAASKTVNPDLFWVSFWYNIRIFFQEASID
jgi:hypothetical protein